MAMFLRTGILLLVAAGLSMAQAVPRLSWFNPRERLVAVDSDRNVEISIHTPEGRWLENLHPSRLRGSNVYEVSPEIPSGLYLLRLRSAGGERLERILLF
jgi:hypothetical protein